MIKTQQFAHFQQIDRQHKDGEKVILHDNNEISVSLLIFPPDGNEVKAMIQPTG